MKSFARQFRFYLVLIAVWVSYSCVGLTFAAPSNPQRARTRIPPPSPESVLGFQPATSRTIADWKQITEYFQKLDKASDRIELRTLGKTAEGRILFVVLISAPENLRQAKRLMEIQKCLADPRLIKDSKQREACLRNGKTVVAITCSLHSTEIVASQMSLQLAYELASSNTPETREILQNTIVLLFPSPNPDGIDLVADWYRQTFDGPYEGTPPPQLYHRYAGHDNNRDWYMLTQPETQHITRFFYRDWFPQIVYDLHQQGMYGPRMALPPFFDPPNPNIPGLLLREVATIGERMATDLAARKFTGVLTRAVYDTWWHGGLRTAPYYHNSVGLLSEAASAKLMTPLEVRSEDLLESVRGLANLHQRSTTYPDPWVGGTWTPEIISDMELTACRSLLVYAARYRKEFLENQLQLSEQAIQLGESETPRYWIIPAKQHDPEAAARLVNVLWSQGIDVRRTTDEFSVDEEKFPRNSFIIPMAQPFRACAKALLEVQAYPERSTISGEAETPYDITGWTLPLLMGVEVKQIDAVSLEVDSEEMTELLPKAAQWVNQPTPLPSAEKSTARLGIYHSFVPNEDEGWTRWLLDMKQIPYQVLTNHEVQSSELRKKFDTLIMADQSPMIMMYGWSTRLYPEDYAGGLGMEGIEALKKFVLQGGKLVCLGRASDFAIENFELPVRNLVRGKMSSEFYCPGSILGLEVDTDSSIGRNSQKESHAFFAGGCAFKFINGDPRVKVIARYSKEHLLQSGWLRGEEVIAGQPALVEFKSSFQKAGKVILFGFRPQFRGQSHGTFSLFLNCLD